MKRNMHLLLLCLAFLLPVSCSTFAPAPTPTPTATRTPLPPTPTAKPDLLALLPTGRPLTSWNDIPIMPGAIAGEGDTGTYRFSIRAQATAVQAYYDRILAGLGWSGFAAGQGTTGSILLIYMKGQDMLTVSILVSDGPTVVMLVKS